MRIKLPDGTFAEDVRIRGDVVEGTHVLPNGHRLRFKTTRDAWARATGESTRSAEPEPIDGTKFLGDCE